MTTDISDATIFPSFPTLFTSEDAERLRKLEEQKKRMEEVYQAKFTPAAWAKVSVPEKAVRGILPSWLAPVAGIVTPKALGLEFGFTPEQAQKERLELEEEYKELVRKQKVTRLLPPIKETLRALALSPGGIVTDAGELKSIFKLGEMGFSEEEVGYVTEFAQKLLWASPEEIASGEVFEMRPLSPEDVEELARSAVEPRQVLTTVALSKSLEDFTAALQAMYAPQVEDLTGRDKAIQEYVESIRTSGVTKESSEELFKKIAEEEGEVLVLIDDSTGTMVAASKKPDNTVWVEGELIGYYDEKNKQVVPLSLKGQSLLTDESQESAAKDLWDGFYLGLHQAWYGTKQGLLNALLDTMNPRGMMRKLLALPTGGVSLITTDEQEKFYARAVEQIGQWHDVRESQYREWLKEHPELAPRPEYTQNPFEHTELFKDPYYYAYTMISNAPIIGTALLVGLATTLATKNPWAGAIAGAAVITPVQINSVYEDLIANGADPANANELATSVGTLMGAVEIIPGMIALKIISPAFMGIFRQNLQKELTRQVIKQLSVKGILSAAGKIEIAETLEEVLQESMQNAAVKTVNENRSILENLPQTAVTAAIATAPLAFFGGGAQYVSMKQNLPPKIQEEIDTTAKKMVEAGLTPEHAEAVAVAKVMETETGQAAVELAIEKTDEEIPTPEAKPSKIGHLESKLTAINEDIATFTSSIEVQKQRLQKMKENREVPSEQLAQVNTVNDLKENLAELELQKVKLEKNLKKLRKVAVPEAIPPAVEEVPIVPEPRTELPVAPEEGLRHITPDKRPRIQDWSDEQENITATLEANPDIAKAIQISKSIKEARERAERTWRETDEEQRKAIRKEAGLSRSVIAKEWSDMTPPEQQALALAAIPDRSIHFPISKEIFDIRYYMQFLQEETGLPFYEVFKRAELSHGAARIVQEKFLQRIGQDPFFSHLRTDDAGLARVAQEINSRNPVLKIESPEGLLENELLLANVIEEMYQEYQNKVRYLRVMRTTGTLDALKAEFPDAPETELALVSELRQTENLDDLWSFLNNLEWGVIGSGYDPWMVSYPKLTPSRVRIGTTRGASRLMRRESIEFPEIKMERNVLLRLATYLKQMEAQWRIEPELDVLEELWSKAGVKFSNLGQVESALREWTRELQGIPTRQSFFDSVLRRVWRQAMSAVFLHPWMSFRNVHQPLAFHPDRTELVRIKELPADIKVKAGVYYDAFVSQLKGIRRDWLYTGERGLPGLGWLTRLSDSMSLYAHSDNSPRRISFEASMNKARRATEQYRRDGNVAKWLKDSGANHLRQTERNYALQLLVQPTHDLAVPGLREVSGDEMASFYIGHEVANMTHFIYERAFRAPVEFGATGRTLYNLIVFPRGFFQRVYFQAQKLPNPKEIFSTEISWEQARAGFKDVILLTIVGSMISEWLRVVTGRPRRAYNPLDIIQWQLGGLVLGVGMELTKLISDIVVALDPTADEEYKAQAMSRLPGALIRQADVLVPFYRNIIDSFEAATGTKNWDVHKLRQLRAILDDSYTPEEVEEMDRNLWEKLRKAVLAGEPPDPTKFQEIQANLLENQSRLGEMDAEGKFYTLRQFGGDIKTLTKPLPDDMLTENHNFSELVVFYKESEDKWEELYKLPTTPAGIRTEWRESHIEEEAMLLFWGMYSKSVFRLGTPEWEQVSGILQTWFSYYGVDKRMHGKWADWTLTEQGLDNQ